MSAQVKKFDLLTSLVDVTTMKKGRTYHWAGMPAACRIAFYAAENSSGTVFDQIGVGQGAAGSVTLPDDTAGYVKYAILAGGTPAGTAKVWVTAEFEAGDDTGEYGDGSDGDLVFDGAATVLGLAPVANVYTLTRDIYPSSLLLESGISIDENGFAIVCSGSLEIDSTAAIHCDGHAAVTSTAGAISNASASSCAGTAGGAGRAGSSGVGVAGTANAFGFPGATGGAGGAGGGDGTNVGGAGGAFTALAAVKGGARDFWSLLKATIIGTQTGGTAMLASGFGGGSGGGGGAVDSTGTGGGGGGAAGVCRVFAANLINNGHIRAKGGAGASGVAPTNAGGGGGGGGGVAIAVSDFYSGSGDITAPGGAGGAKVGASGVAGVPGTAGTVIHIVAENG